MWRDSLHMLQDAIDLITFVRVHAIQADISQKGRRYDGATSLDLNNVGFRLAQSPSAT